MYTLLTEEEEEGCLQPRTEPQIGQASTAGCICSGSSPSCGILPPPSRRILSSPSVHPYPAEDPSLHPPATREPSPRPQEALTHSLTLSFWKEWRKLPPSSPSSLGVPGGLLMPLMLFGEFCRRWGGEAVSRSPALPKTPWGQDAALPAPATSP